MTPTRTLPRLRMALVLSTAFVVGGLASGDAGASPPDAAPDCGVNALFLLLQLQDHPTTLDRIDKVLPPRDRVAGYSMAELASASRSLGLPLEGVRFGTKDVPLDRPAIAYFKKGNVGHFAVLRPVGTTGTMVQVIDPPRPVRIVDYDRLFADTPWTNRILMPRDPWLRRNATALAIAFGMALLLGYALPRLRGLGRRLGTRAGITQS